MLIVKTTTQSRSMPLFASLFALLVALLVALISPPARALPGPRPK
jgi:hypothetical protein